MVVLKITKEYMVEMSREEATIYLITRVKFLKKEEDRIESQIKKISQNIGFVRRNLMSRLNRHWLS